MSNQDRAAREQAGKERAGREQAALNSPAKRITIEVCVDDIDVARAAVDAGADRLEINSRLDLDGLTPADNLVTESVRLGVPVIAMARPDTANNRFTAAGFCYSEVDKRRLVQDADRVLQLGAHGIAAGALLADGAVDEPFLQELREICTGRQLVFHRAFDVCEDWRRALVSIVRGGADRLLTSGCAMKAEQGVPVLAEMVERDEIEILPASGISSANAETIVKQTGCSQIHGSFSSAAIGTGTGPERVAARIRELRVLFPR
ncbi:MAG: copper homeostasis protein CutC [Planctomycetota bacterium]